MRKLEFGGIPGGSIFGEGFGTENNRNKARIKRNSVVYFIQEGVNGPIKIGFTCTLKQRLTTLQTGNPAPLKVLGTFPGGQLEEDEIHRKFRHLKINREWFRVDESLLSFIEQKTGWERERKLIKEENDSLKTKMLERKKESDW